MTAVSFPLSYVEGGPDANLSHAQWRDLMSQQSGYYDPALAGLNLGLPSSGDSATVAVGKYRFKGFCLHVTATHSLTLAAATSSPLTYRIGIMYDPTRESNAAGPLYLYAGLTSAITTDTPAGGAFCPLYQVTRQVSQTLDQAAVVDLRQWVFAPVFRFDGDLPSPADYPYGQILVMTWPKGSGMLTLMVRRGGVGTEIWHKLSGPYANASQDFYDVALPTGANGLSPFTTATRPWWTRSAGRIYVGGVVKRTSGADFAADTEYTITQFDGGNVPLREATFPVAVSTSGTNQGAGRLSLKTDGRLIYSGPVAAPWVALDGVSWFPKGT